MISKFKGSAIDLGWKFKAAYMASTVKEYEEYMALLDSEDTRIRPWLEKIGSHKWAKCVCGPRMYDIMTSNCAESMNNVDVSAREYSVAKLIDSLRVRMQQWFTERKEKAEKTTSFLTKNVKSYWFHFKVKLGNSGACTCGEFQLSHFVCIDAVAVIGFRPHLSCYDFISPYYTRHYWYSTWSAVMHPIIDPSSWVVPSNVLSIRCKPPLCEKMPVGRPRKSRIPSIGEHRGTKRKKCSRCHVVGHNKKTCRNVIPLPTSL
ncbi:unnamed protein product [Cuscuta europaea]|uniref:SWIM-type domain-containing protein n=1 Tax=Cuscuta europaea TaxID=41803 RepID=A0A9P1E1R5_CUSEU|nr:unnamed protein product [Cuscuta europaea]